MHQKFSSETYALINPVTVISLLACIVLGGMASDPRLGMAQAIDHLCSYLSSYFPFSAIENQASVSRYPGAIRAQLTILWVLSPVFFLVVGRASSKRLIRLRIGPLERKSAYYALYGAGVILGLVNIIWYIPSTHICGKCEVDSILFSAIFKCLYFFLVAYSLGKIVALFNFKGERE